MAVRERIHDRLSSDIASGTRPVLDDELLSKSLRQPLSHQARDNVGRVAGGEADDQTYRTHWIGLGHCNSRHGRKGGSRRSQLQKLTA
jgi:hypothetical protein